MSAQPTRFPLSAPGGAQSRFSHLILLIPLLLPLLSLSACRNESSDPPTGTAAAVTPSQTTEVSAVVPEPIQHELTGLENPMEEQWPTTYKAALPGSSVIPYPLYPNATKYRIGGEHGLKIVVFETTDSFAEVDDFFQQLGSHGLSRLDAESEYVRYASEQNDEDPWGTHRPGIVIHQFASISEAARLGAAPESITNIIMSYR